MRNEYYFQILKKRNLPHSRTMTVVEVINVPSQQLQVGELNYVAQGNNVKNDELKI